MTLRAFTITTFIAAACAAALPAPAAAADKETRQMMADIRMLQEQSQQLQSLIGQLTDALKTLDTRMEARIDDQTNTTRKALADQKLVVDSVSSELRVLREKADDNNVRVGSLTQEVAALRQLVTQLGTSRSSAPPADDPAATSPSTADAPGAPSVAGASPGQIFSSALTDYYSGDYALAILGFQAYIKSFPRAENSADAQLNIGNCYLNDGKYKQAVDAYDTTIRTYPDSKSLAEAYYKKGVALQALGQTTDAQDAFKTVMKTYPDTDPARLAQQRLQEVKK